MAATRKLNVEILGDARSVLNSFQDTSSGASRMADEFVGFGKKVAAGMAGIGIGAVALGKSFVDAAIESQKVSKQTEAIITATGGAAGLTADQIGDMATAMSNKTGIDDEAIQTSMNLLLTFKQLRNETGQGNDVFTRASAAALDLGNVFGSADAAAVQLGKALSDPVKGITALRKSGINFTEEQQTLIKSLVASGDLLGAQKVILGEVEAQVGGTAAATATAGDKMKVAFDNLKESLGNRLMPIFETFARVVVERIIPAIEHIVSTYGPKLVQFFRNLWDRIQPVVSALANRLQPILASIVDWIKNNLDTVKVFFGVIAGAVVIAGIVGLAAAFASLFNPVVLVIAGIAALAAGFQYAYKNSETFRDVVGAVVTFFRDTVIPAFITAWNWLRDTISNFVDGFRSRLDDIKAAMINIKEFIQGVLDVIAAGWRLWGDNILSFLATTFNAIKDGIQAALGLIKGVIDFFLGVLSGDWGRAWDGIKSIVSNVLDLIKSAIEFATAPIVLAFSVITDGIGRAMEALKTAISAALNWIKDLFKTIFDAIASTVSSIFTGIVDGIKGVINGILGFIESGINTAVRAINKMIKALEWINGPSDFPRIPEVEIPRLADGGLVDSPTLAMIGEAGPEAVVPLTAQNMANFGGGGATINVYVEGSVTAERDLVEAIRVGLLDAQRSGLQLVI